MNAQMLMPIASLMLIRSLDTEDPDVQRNIYIAFGVVQSVVLVVGALLYIKIKASTDMSVVDVPPQKVPFQSEEQAGEIRKMPAKDYDAEQFSELYLKKIIMTLCIVSFVSYKWGHVIPLLFQCLHNPMQVYSSHLFKIHVLGQEAKGDLARPFPQPDPMGFMNALAPKPKQQ
jgi:hypothetical protein